MDFSQIEAIVGVLRDSRLTEIEVRQGDAGLRLRRSTAKTPARPAPVSAAPVDTALPAPTEPSREASGAVEVTAGLVGVFHHLREPVVEGDVVAERQILGQIESMRLMNDCLAPAAGRVVAVHVDEEQPVEYGQVLFEIVTEEGTEPS